METPSKNSNLTNIERGSQTRETERGTVGSQILSRTVCHTRIFKQIIF